MKKILAVLVVITLACSTNFAYAEGKAELWETLIFIGKIGGKVAAGWWKNLTEEERQRYMVTVKNKVLYKQCPICMGFRGVPCPGEYVQTVNGPVRLPCVAGVVNIPSHQDMWGNWYTQPVRHALCNGYGAIRCPQCGGNGYVSRF